MLANIFVLTTGLAATTSAFTCEGNYFSFFNRDGPALSYQRLDPALYPGTDSPHLHSFDGSNSLSASTEFADTQKSTCTTARIKPDKSLYWRPTLFWNGNNTGFYRVPEKATKIYYKYGDGNNWANVTEFPSDFNMIAGKPNKRADGDNPAGVRWGCHQPDGGSTDIYANGFPTGFQSCDYGFASEVTFPSCWNGEKLDPKNPNAHMAYPNGVMGVGVENCPTTHRAARFPTIFIEFWYDIKSFNKQYSKDSNPWVLSNGDPTGYSFHGDFLNGWETGVLGKAIAKDTGCRCGCGCGQTEMEQCFGSANVNKDGDADFQSCSVAATKSTESAPLLDVLPGCNPIQAGPADATPVTGGNCAMTAVPSSGGAKSSVAASSAPYTLSSKPSSSQAYASSVAKDAGSLASVSLPNKQINDGYGPTNTQPLASATSVASSQQYGNAPSISASAAQSTPASGLPSLSLVSQAGAVGSTSQSTSKPSGVPSGNDGDCKAPVYVTVTPTMFVTAGVNSTACGLGTVTKTLTQTATITVDAQGGFEYGSY